MSDALGWGSVSERRKAWLDLTLLQAGFPARAVNALQRLTVGVDLTLRDVVSRDRKGIMWTRGIGKKTVDAIEQRLAERGLRLGMLQKEIDQFEAGD